MEDLNKKTGLFGGISKKEARIREIAESRPAKEINLRERPDRVSKYLKKYMDNFVFDEFSEKYIKENGMESFMKDVPIPLRKEDIEAFNSKEGVENLLLAENMAWVIGIDPKFKYIDNYIQYMGHCFGNKTAEALTKEGKDEGEKDNYDSACIHFRAALCFAPYDLSAMYGYSRACRKMYQEGGSVEYVGDLKSEAFDYLELITEIHPKFAQAHYYLGYAYLNMGLYQKAHLVWQDFLNKSHINKDKKEIKKRMAQLAVPMEIEKGYNAVLSHRWEEGIQILEPYLKSQYKDWWPLHYYLGVAYISRNRRNAAVTRFNRVLELNPSHIETMEELANIYKAENKQEQFEKYMKKANLLREGGYKDTPGSRELAQGESAQDKSAQGEPEQGESELGEPAETELKQVEAEQVESEHAEPELKGPSKRMRRLREKE